MSLWTAVELGDKEIYICDINGVVRLRLYSYDPRLARAIADTLNSSNHWRLDANEEEMDLRGVPKVEVIRED